MAAVSVRMLSRTVVGLLRTALLIAALTVVSFGAADLVVNGAAAAVAGLAIYVLVLAVLRPRGLLDAWRYVRALHA
jgi:hypothetical protein